MEKKQNALARVARVIARKIVPYERSTKAKSWQELEKFCGKFINSTKEPFLVELIVPPLGFANEKGNFSHGKRERISGKEVFKTIKGTAIRLFYENPKAYWYAPEQYYETDFYFKTADYEGNSMIVQVCFNKEKREMINIIFSGDEKKLKKLEEFKFGKNWKILKKTKQASSRQSF